MSYPSCIEPFNKRRSKVTCPFCDYASCSSCTKIYVLSRRELAHCMNCKKLWDRFFIVDKLGTTFVNKEYKNERKNIMYDLEKAMLFETQPYVEQTKKIVELENTKTKNNQKINDLNRILVQTPVNIPENMIKWGELCKDIYNLTTSKDRKSTRLNSSHVSESRMPSSA